MCTKQFSSQEQKLQRLCVGENCQCMTGRCDSQWCWLVFLLDVVCCVSNMLHVSLCVNYCYVAACAAYRGNVDLTLTAVKRTEETCQPHIKYGEKEV